FVADGRANWVRVLGPDGKQLGRFGEKGTAPGQFQMPHMLCVDSRGDVYVAEVTNKRVQKFTTRAADPWLGEKVLATKAGVTLTETGKDGKPVTLPVRHIVYTVVAEDGHRVRVNYPGGSVGEPVTPGFPSRRGLPRRRSASPGGRSARRRGARGP